jgi:hypothetical protein
MKFIPDEYMYRYIFSYHCICWREYIAELLLLSTGYVLPCFVFVCAYMSVLSLSLFVLAS